VLNQLGGDALTGTGVARHTANLDAGGAYRGFGLRLAGSYASPTHVNSSGQPGDLPLDFGSLTTFNLRLFADLGRMPSVVKKFAFLKGSRLSLAVNNVFDTIQKVTDSTGATPLRYQPGYIDPVGRLIKLELRKQF
jgi:outer membrane receptor protein involved in Fe transport